MDYLNCDFSDQRIHHDDTRTFPVYIVQVYRKGKSWRCNWGDASVPFDTVAAAVRQMKRMINEKYDELEEGGIVGYRVICRLDVPVSFDFCVKRVRDCEEEGDEMENR